MQTPTKYFGTLSYEADAVLEFPDGLPGFEGLRRFVSVEMPEQRPLVFLQSLDDPEVCFLTLPARSVEAGYRLEMSAADRELLGFQRRPRIGREALCLIIITVDAQKISANLLAPLVINLANRRGVQAILAESGYSHQHVLAEEEAPVCS